MLECFNSTHLRHCVYNRSLVRDDTRLGKEKQMIDVIERDGTVVLHDTTHGSELVMTIDEAGNTAITIEQILKDLHYREDNTNENILHTDTF